VFVCTGQYICGGVLVPPGPCSPSVRGAVLLHNGDKYSNVSLGRTAVTKWLIFMCEQVRK
jgi:hypothetical protein